MFFTVRTIISAPPLWTQLTLITSIKDLSLNTITLGFGTSSYEFWGNTSIQSVAQLKFSSLTEEWRKNTISGTEVLCNYLKRI